jgi:hypothetical protein
MANLRPLPLAEEWKDPESYVKELLNFATSSILFMNLCGGVHILDFLTRKPDLYSTVLPAEWREFFEYHDVHEVLHLLLHENIEPLRGPQDDENDDDRTWNGGARPPQSLLDYIHNIRRLSLRREFDVPPPSMRTPLPYKTTVGMNKKKLHEVEFFSRHVASLSDVVNERRGEPISHIVDFGSGQNYLGRTLASSPYHKHIIAIERHHHNISGAQGMDVHAMLAKKKEKKVFVHKRKTSCNDCDGKPEVADSGETPTSPPHPELPQPSIDTLSAPDTAVEKEEITTFKMLGEMDLGPNELRASSSKKQSQQQKLEEAEVDTRGKLSYIEHDISDGYLEPIINHVVHPSQVSTPNQTQDSNETSITVNVDEEQPSDARVMVVSLHSCGNLLHHGVRSLVLNPSVVAVAMIGCCYNLMTERLGPATNTLPILRSLHPRLNQTGNSYDPHGFPMSQRFETYESEGTTGMKLNITARMMAVQAPYNWGREESEGFFTRHFFRALFQRVLVDRGVVPQPGIPKDLYNDAGEPIDRPPPLILGSLRKSAFTSFTAYVRTATVRLSRDPHHGTKIQEHICTMTDDELDRYEKEYQYARKNLSMVWSLMAFSAQVVEAIIVTDRWQFLREHDSVKECWVEPVFDYSISPRNLAVIGIKA